MYATKNNHHKALNLLLTLNSTAINEQDDNHDTILTHIMNA